MNPSNPITPISGDTFVPAPLDDSKTLLEIYDWHLEHSPNHPLWTWAEGDGTVGTAVWSEAVIGVHNAQRFIESKIGTPAVGRQSRVVAILATIDSPTFWMLMMGLMRTGWVPFPISTRNSEIGVAHLISKTNAEFLFTSRGPAIQVAAAAATALVVEGGHVAPQLVVIPAFAELFVPGEPLPPASPPGLDSEAMILHSSGSTSFPKPIVITHRHILGWCRAPTYGPTNLTGHIMSIHTLPMFHVMGTLQMFWTAAVGMVSSVFSPNAPPAMATPDLVLDAAILTRSTLIFCIPAFIEHWSRDPSRLEALKAVHALIYAGASLDPAVGDVLIAEGVTLVSVYGLTETGPLTMVFPSTPEPDGWDYFKIAPNCNPIFVPYGEPEEKVFQLVLVDSPSHLICVHNTEVEGKAAYDTSDLLVQHPTRTDLWRIFGRADDQIMMSTGEKTNPVPIEAIVGKHPMIASVLVFGRSRLNAGLLVEPAASHVFDPEDLDKLAQFRNAIWKNVEQANTVAPSHSRIFKEMIVVANPNKPFQYTPKGTPRRHVVINSYEEEIEATYVAAEMTQVEIPIPSSWNLVGSACFARAAVEHTMAGVLLDSDDLFSKGCDSLQATWIRNTILHGLHTANISTSKVSQNFVYEHPTIGRLAQYLTAIAGGHEVGEIHGGKAAEMDAMVEAYSRGFAPHRPAVRSGDVVLLTGSTGGLGSYLLEELVKNTSISRVYAVNRNSGSSTIYERQAASFGKRGISLGILDSPKLVLLEGNTSSENFGLAPNVFEALQRDVTNIIHNSWKVNFNISLSSMESLVGGTRRLIDLALSSPRAIPPTFIFTSSIGVFKNWDKPTSAPEGYVPASTAVSNGYGESKWVAEALLLKAAQLNPSFKPTIVRVGQLAGGSNGSWNTSEWLPSLIKSGQVLGCLPLAGGLVSWLPCHLAAAALVEARNGGAPFMNLCHPRPVSWSSVFEAFAAGLDVPLVPYAEWLTALEECKEDAIANPAVLLLKFFRASNIEAPSPDAEALGFPRLEMGVAVRVAPSLLEMEEVGREDVEKWLAYWRFSGFLE